METLIIKQQQNSRNAGSRKTVEYVGLSDKAVLTASAPVYL